MTEDTEPEPEEAPMEMIHGSITSLTPVKNPKRSKPKFPVGFCK